MSRWEAREVGRASRALSAQKKERVLLPAPLHDIDRRLLLTEIEVA